MSEEIRYRFHLTQPPSDAPRWQRPVWVECSGTHFEDKVFVGASDYDALAERLAEAEAKRNELAALFDALNCPAHGEWLNQDYGYAICGHCHGETKDRLAAAEKVIEALQRYTKWEDAVYGSTRFGAAPQWTDVHNALVVYRSASEREGKK